MAAALAAAAVAVCSYAAGNGRKDVKTDDDGHVLASLWKEYDDAYSADRPQKAEQVLDAIIGQAKSRGYVWDFYDALVKWHDVVLSRDWKRSTEVSGRIKADAEEFGNPVVLYNLAAGRLVQENIDSVWYSANVAVRSDKLKQARNEHIYAADANLAAMPDFIRENISNDYEYLLWSLSYVRKYHSSSVAPDVRVNALNDLSLYLGGTYPSGAYLEFRNIPGYSFSSDNESRTAALKAFVEKYDDKAISLLASMELLLDRKNTCDRSGWDKSVPKATSDDYRKLRDDCAGFEKLRKSFSGREAVIADSCTGIKELISKLDSKVINVTMDDLTAVVTLRNLEKASVELRKDSLTGPVVDKAMLKNTVCSYYVADTVRYSFPDTIDDGDYVVICREGDSERMCMFSKNTVSIAYRTNARGLGIYVADYKTGEPIGKADLEMIYKGRTVKTAKDFEFDGFTSVDVLVDSLKTVYSGALMLKCSFTDADGIYRSSQSVYIPGDRAVPDVSTRINAMILKDRSAFNPGDTVSFKAILYSVNDGRYDVLPEGKDVNAILYDADGKNVASLPLTTNEFGAVAGDFSIPLGVKGGSFCIAVSVEGTVYGSSRFTVDEFVLPTYTLEFSKDTSLYYNGDTVVVRGHIASYSGHSISAAKLLWSVRSGRMDEVAAGEISETSRGDFEFSFRIPDGGYADMAYYVTVKSVDQTGETLEWTTTYRVERSLVFDMSLENTADGSMAMSQPWQYVENHPHDSAMLDGEVARFKTKVWASGSVSDEVQLSIPIEYRVRRDSETVLAGTVLSGSVLEVDLTGMPSGLYVVDAETVFERPDGKKDELKYTYHLLKTGRGDSVLDADVEFFSRKYDGQSIAVQAGCTKGPQWIVAELYGDKAQLLHSEIVYLDGVKGQEGSVRLIEYEYMDEYPDAVSLCLFSFKNGRSRSASYSFFRDKASDGVLPLEFTSFTDRSVPRAECVFGIKTLPGVECAVSVFDISTERIARNIWQAVVKQEMRPLSVNYRSRCGGVESGGDAIPFLLASSNKAASGSALTKSVMVRGASSAFDSESAVEMSRDMAVEESFDEMAGADDITIRENFDNTLAFFPFLRADDEGNVEFRVNTSDKLSTYCVQLFAHNKEMDNAASRHNFLVTMPIKVSVVQPQFLYGGDVYRLKASVSNGSDEEISGNLQLYVYDSSDYSEASPVLVRTMPLAVGAGDSAAGEFEVDVPCTDSGILGFKVVYRAESGGQTVSDGMFVTVPVYRPVQTLTEAHSALLLAGMDRDSLKTALASLFTGTLGQTLQYREISLLDMILEAVPDKVEPKSDDVLSVTEAYYVNVMAGVLNPDKAESDGASAGASAMSDESAASDSGMTDESAPADSTMSELASDSELVGLLSKIMACQNSDGGFAWFEGFKSSPVLTAVVLERFALLRDFVRDNEAVGSIDAAFFGRFFNEAVPDAVKYLDDRMFADEYPSWYGGISLEQYLYLRSMYPEITFVPKADKKAVAEFRKEVKSWLLPSKNAGLNGYILQKARRMATALNLSCESSASLASSLGVSSRKSLTKSVEADITSLLEYAVAHPSGGIYYPNAVMPFRGLLESEVYAHSLICNLMSRYSELYSSSPKTASIAAEAWNVAEGIRLWLMVQKETQQWDNDPAYINAVASVLAGSDDVKSASVAVLSKKYMKPFEQVAASGNGFTVVRKFYRLEAADEKDEGGTGQPLKVEIKEGDVLCTGDKLLAEYKVWSAENRSFVRLVTPRYAALRPVQQLSGNTGGWFRPLYSGGAYGVGFSVSPYAYREVKADRTNWYIDVCPEEYTTFSEEFYVTQSGIFTAPAVTIESLYAPHYRANDMFGGLLRVE